MRKIRSLTLILFSFLLMNACSEQDNSRPVVDEQVPDEVMMALENAGYNTFDQVPITFEDGYLVEGDIYIRSSEIDNLQLGSRLPVEEQYSTNNLVSTGDGRVITIYAPVASTGRGKKTPGYYSTSMIAGLDEAISRYNTENLNISFQRITTNNADITMTRLKKGDERRGILGSAGFPTASGDPYGEIKMSGVLESSYGLSTDGIATIIAHEMGHCIGFRHTDYFDRSISCGGGTSNEGAAGIGANLIPETPAGASASDKS